MIQLADIPLNIPEMGPAYRVICDSSGHFFYADEYNHRVLKISEKGQLLRAFGSLGNGPEQFHYPCGMAVCNDRLHVCDSWNHRVVVLDLAGNFLSSFGSLGKESGNFQTPTDLCLGCDDELLVLDFGNERIQVFDQEFSWLDQYDIGRPCDDRPFDWDQFDAQFYRQVEDFPTTFPRYLIKGDLHNGLISERALVLFRKRLCTRVYRIEHAQPTQLLAILPGAALYYQRLSRTLVVHDLNSESSQVLLSLEEGVLGVTVAKGIIYIFYASEIRLFQLPPELMQHEMPSPSSNEQATLSLEDRRNLEQSLLGLKETTPIVMEMVLSQLEGYLDGLQALMDRYQKMPLLREEEHSGLIISRFALGQQLPNQLFVDEVHAQIQLQDKTLARYMCCMAQLRCLFDSPMSDDQRDRIQVSVGEAILNVARIVFSFKLKQVSLLQDCFEALVEGREAPHRVSDCDVRIFFIDRLLGLFGQALSSAGINAAYSQQVEGLTAATPYPFILLEKDPGLFPQWRTYIQREVSAEQALAKSVSYFQVLYFHRQLLSGSYGEAGPVGPINIAAAHCLECFTVFWEKGRPSRLPLWPVADEVMDWLGRLGINNDPSSSAWHWFKEHQQAPPDRLMSLRNNWACFVAHDYQTVIDLSKTATDSRFKHLWLTFAHNGLGQREQAKKELNTLIKRSEQDKSLIYLIAIAHELSGRMEDAYPFVLAHASAQPLMDPLLKLVLVCAWTGRWDEGFKVLEEHEATLSFRVRTVYSAILQRSRGEYDVAGNMMARLADDRGEMVHYQTGIIQRLIGDKEAALEHFREEHKRYPKWLNLLQELLTLQSLGSTEAAKKLKQSLPVYAYLFWDGQRYMRDDPQFDEVAGEYIKIEQSDPGEGSFEQRQWVHYMHSQQIETTYRICPPYPPWRRT